MPQPTRQPLEAYRWPPLPDGTTPVWTGRGFTVGGQQSGVLSYDPDPSGWTEDLTSFHEAEAGSHHPIDQASRAQAQAGLRFLDGHVPPGQPPIVLEIGCSSGLFLQELRRHRPDAAVIGSDVIRAPLERLAAEEPELPLLQFNLETCPLPERSVDAVVLLNVLEHIADDATALRQVRRILRPGGVALIEVPAGPRLYDVYDRLLMHHRRYSMASLQRRVRAAGLEVVSATHLGALVFPGFLPVKLYNRRFLSRERAIQQHVVASNITSTRSSSLLRWAFQIERTLGRWVRWPFGIRCLLVVRRPQHDRA